MKKILLILFVSFLWQALSAQCYPDRHNTTWYDGWISCQTAPSPNPLRGNSHWVQYNLGETYVLHDLFVWNTNAPDLLDWGMQEVVIDYSIDGTTWEELGTYNLNQGTGFNRYEGEFVTDFNSVRANYVLITGLNNFGGACYGLSEVKINVDNTVDIKENNCLKATVYPNPFGSQLNLRINENCTNSIISYSIVDAMGRIVVQSNTINKGETKEILSDQKIVAGIYFVKLSDGEQTSKIKVIKYQ
jgi:hypothetical protein